MKARNTNKIASMGDRVPPAWIHRARSLRNAADQFAFLYSGFVHPTTWVEKTNCAYFTVMGEVYVFRVFGVGAHYCVTCVGMLTPPELFLLIKESLTN